MYTTYKPRTTKQIGKEFRRTIGRQYRKAIGTQKSYIPQLESNYANRIATSEKSRPLITQRYNQLLADLSNEETQGKAQAAKGEEAQIGGILQTEANRGNWGGSVENSELSNTRQGFANIVNNLVADIGSRRSQGAIDRDTGYTDLDSLISDLMGEKSEKIQGIREAISDLFLQKAEARSGFIEKAQNRQEKIEQFLDEYNQEQSQYDTTLAEEKRQFDINAELARLSAASRGGGGGGRGKAGPSNEDVFSSIAGTVIRAQKEGMSQKAIRDLIKGMGGNPDDYKEFYLGKPKMGYQRVWDAKTGTWKYNPVAKKAPSTPGLFDEGGAWDKGGNAVADYVENIFGGGAGGRW